ncbi:hypothetical protein DVH24_037940 [Malus domestica]|uniref:Dynamin-related protein 3A n=1 Tax=Malus domestica TaxID=3750 RepID=A0A498K4Z9_MALDO|nr:hypothetical protein DVH24_037940 [Malus domestica]
MADEPSVAPPQSGSSPSPSASPLGNSVIPIANKLQDIFAQLGSQSTIELPQVAVVGSQSSGKSSVLEALVGRDFLPRGSEICTRRPLVLQLLQTKRNADGTDEEYGEFLHVPGKRFYDFSEIRREIQAETEREAGGNKGVTDKQIRLKIFSPNVLDITLVDLPGITKVPVGDQPSDIEARIRTMIMSYIKIPTCLILAVTAANSDLANSDALQIAGNADPDGLRTIGVITKLDIMDRGTDARNLLLGKVIPLRLGYVGVVNRSQEDIMMNRSIKDALVAEEKFFRSRPVYNGLADRCGVPQLAKKLNQILVQHIKAVLPGLKSRISSTLVTVAKEHASYGEITESKAGQGALLLNILSKYCEAFSTMVEGKNEEMSTTELSGGARIHYIFQNIFVKSLEEVDPCEDLTDDDIRTAIQNATGPRSALFVPEISHRCLVSELQRFPILRRRMDEVIGNFLREGLEPSETMIGHIIEMEMDYINTSHANFVGGSKAVEVALQQVKSSRIPLPLSRQKDGVDSDKAPTSERSLKSRTFLARPVNGMVPEQRSNLKMCWHQVFKRHLMEEEVYEPEIPSHTDDEFEETAQPRMSVGARPVADNERVASSGNILGGSTGSSWGISSIFGGNDNRTPAKESLINKPYNEPINNIEQAVSMIHLSEPPTILRPTESHSEQETIEIAVTKLLLRSYYDIVRKNIEDSVPKAIMHFLVNHTKRELHNVFIKKLYRENLFEEMLQEPDEVAMKRKRTRETLRVLQQAFRTLDELPLEADTVEKGYSLGADPTGLPKIHGLPTSSLYNTSSSHDSYSSSPKNTKSRKSSHSGELHSPFYSNADSNGSGRMYMPGLYPTVDP